MTDLLDRAVAGLRTLPPEQQDDVARMLLEWTGGEQMPVVLSPAEDEVRAIWAKHGL